MVRQVIVDLKRTKNFKAKFIYQSQNNRYITAKDSWRELE